MELHIMAGMEPTLFEAIADPTRRALLDRLRRSGAQSIRELAADLPMTRQAVTKHLDALAAARLVRVRRTGRARLHELDGRPLREVDEWLRPYAEAWDRRLDALKAHLEEEQG
jgi:DNA-binding transcriptional ArsR family regulator